MVRPSAAATALVEVPAGCGSSTEFDSEVRQRLADDSVLEKTQVRLEHQGDGYTLHVRVGDESRTLHDTECEPLFHAAVVVTVAIALSEAREKSASARPVSPTPSPTRSTGTGTPRPTERESATPRQHDGSGFGASFGLGVGAGIGPNPALALELEARASWTAVGVAAGVRYVAESSHRAGGRGVDIWALGAHVAGLLRPLPLVEARLGISTYRLVGAGVGSAEDKSDDAWALGPAVGLALLPVRGRLGWIGVGGEVHLDVVRSTFEILNHGDVYSVPRAGGVAFVRAGHTFF